VVDAIGGGGMTPGEIDRGVLGLALWLEGGGAADVVAPPPWQADTRKLIPTKQSARATVHATDTETPSFDVRRI